MSHQIEISDEIYDYLIKNVKHLGESPSSILSRLLGVDGTKDTPSSTEALSELPDVGLCLADPKFIAKSKAIDRFLFALSWLCEKNPKAFAQILHIKGRDRKYFAKSKKEINDSGNNAFPQKIPDTPYWVITNNNTKTKQRLLGDVMRVLGYSISERSKLTNALKV